MKRLLLFVVLGGLALTCAAQEPVSSSVEVRGSQIQLPAKAYAMHAPDLQQYAGTYLLSNGETMSLRREGRRLYAQMRNAAPRELVAAAPGEFVALDRQMKLSFDEDAMGGKTFDMLMVAPRKLSSTGAGREQFILLGAR